MRSKALGRTHWASLQLSEYAVFCGYLICIHEITFVSRPFQYQRVFQLQGTSEDWSEPEESQHCAPSSARDDSRCEESHRGLSKQVRGLQVSSTSLPCMTPSCQGTPGIGKTAGNDTGRHESKERVSVETAQNKNMDFLGKSCFSAGVEDSLPD